MVKYSELDATFAALADPTRRAILTRLARGDATVGQLARPFRISAPAISRHLRVLIRAGLLEQHRRGRIRRCRLKPAPLNAAAAWIERRRRFWAGRLEALADFLESTPAPAGDRRRRARTEKSP